MTDQAVTRFYPAPMVSASLNGLYLREDLRRLSTAQRPFVYTNFVASLDGRAAVRGLGEKQSHIPQTIANHRDWRLYQELAAQADVIVVSAGQARAMAHDTSTIPFPFYDPPDISDLKKWRLEHGRDENPVLAVVTSSLDLPFEDLHAKFPNGFLCLTGAGRMPKQTAKTSPHKTCRILQAGPARHVTGKEMVQALGAEGFRTIYSVAGPGVMRTLLQDHVLNRLYLTQVNRLIGGTAYDTIVEAPNLTPPVGLNLLTLYHDSHADHDQTFASYDIEEAP